MGLILRGFNVNDSSFDGARFTVTVFAQPLYIPDTSVVLTIGQSVRRAGRRPGKVVDADARQ